MISGTAMAAERERAEVIGLGALTWLAGNEDLLPVFLGSTGAGIEDLRRGAREPEFLAAVLDFILMDDLWVEALCVAQGWSPEQPARSRAFLPGGDAPFHT